MRITLDEAADEATIVISDERQSYKRGSTHLVLERDPGPDRSRVEVQVGFQGDGRLLFFLVQPASVALPPALLARAERIAR